MYSSNMGMDSHDMMDIDGWGPRIALSMSYNNSGSQPPSIGDVRQIDDSEPSYGIPMDSDGQPPSVNDVGRREASQSEASSTRYEDPDALEVQQHNLELQLACVGSLVNSSAARIDLNDIPEDPCDQKYRTARYKPELSEGTSEKKPTSLDDMVSLDKTKSLGFTDALKQQMEIQKRLHEQLEIQRKLHLRIEEQRKYLQLIVEQQRKMVNGRVKPSSSNQDQEDSEFEKLKASKHDDRSVSDKDSEKSKEKEKSTSQRNKFWSLQ